MVCLYSALPRRLALHRHHDGCGCATRDPQYRTRRQIHPLAPSSEVGLVEPRLNRIRGTKTRVGNKIDGQKFEGADGKNSKLKFSGSPLSPFAKASGDKSRGLRVVRGCGGSPPPRGARELTQRARVASATLARPRLSNYSRGRVRTARRRGINTLPCHACCPRGAACVRNARRRGQGCGLMRGPTLLTSPTPPAKMPTRSLSRGSTQ